MLAVLLMAATCRHSKPPSKACLHMHTSSSLHVSAFFRRNTHYTPRKRRPCTLFHTAWLLRVTSLRVPAAV